MKSRLPQLRLTQRPQGMALVIVLSFIALLSVLVLAFLGSVSMELGSSSSFAASSDVKQRAQTAVNLVIGQIQAATSQEDIAWASQPGMIRTYGADGRPDAQYKLYSSANMVESDFDALSAGKPADVPADWAVRPSEFVDLNEPVLMPDPLGSIVPDPAKLDKKFVAQYPILDPSALATGIKGFSATDVAASTEVGAPAADYNPVKDGNPLPMPVRWLYMLRDGQLRPLENGQIAGATRDNPPVARLAFWTDDESAKINVNTAAGDLWDDKSIAGSYMDLPMASQAFEGLLKNNQPVQHEYQRYPGHPATTYLSAVFPDLDRDELLKIAPRVTSLLNGADVSSQGGTVKTNFDELTTANASAVKKLPLTEGLPLYASVDELFYERDTTARTAEKELFSIPQVEAAKFFFTAQSRAPEINMFNMPRIAMWPQMADPTKRTAFDKTIAFAATVSGQPYYFVRSDPNSPIADYSLYSRNQELYAYLQTLTETPFPGFGGSFQAKYADDRNQILTEMYDYIRSCINLVDSSPGATPYTGKFMGGSTQSRAAVRGSGHVVPIEIPDGSADGTKGFGRSNTLYMPILQFYARETVIHPDDLAANNDPGNDTNGVPQLSTAAEKPNTSRLVTTQMQAVLLINSFSTAQGVVRLVPDLVYEVAGLDSVTVNGVPAGFPGGARRVNFNRNTPNDDYARGGAHGTAGLFWEDGAGNTFKPLNLDGPDKGYPYFSAVIPVNTEVRSPITIESGNIEFRVLDKAGNTVLQTIRLRFPATKIPTPWVGGSYTYNFTSRPILKNATASGPWSTPDAMSLTNSYYQGPTSARQFLNQVTRSLVPLGPGVRGDLRVIAGRKDVDNSVFVPADGYYAPESTFVSASSVSKYQVKYDNTKRDSASAGMLAGAPRSDAGGGWITGYAGSLVGDTSANPPGLKYDQHLVSGTNTAGPLAFYPDGSLNDTDGGPLENAAELETVSGQRRPGDWDNGIASTPDGPYINKADEGEVGSQAYSAWKAGMGIATLFSPNRQVPSPVIMGSLSTGVKRGRPWQTLLFCPNPAAGDSHPGFGHGGIGTGPNAKAPFAHPPDHLLLDLFSMPVVEPYAISEPFSTAGKINMNYQIVPFTYITRNTGLQAILRSTRIPAIPTEHGYVDSGGSKWSYKSGTNAATEGYRLNVEIDETLRGFEERFAANELFRSASQICEMYLVPEGQTLEDTPAWWETGGPGGKGYKLTGDNLRERPYAHIYSRLTTKSNTYIVHVRVQSLQQRRRNNAAEYASWDETKDKVTGEYRASYGIERYLNPNLTGYTTGAPLTDYKFRTLSTKQFTP